MADLSDARTDYIQALGRLLETAQEHEDAAEILADFLHWRGSFRAFKHHRRRDLEEIRDRLTMLEESIQSHHVECPLAESGIDDDTFLRLVSTPGSRPSATKSLREFTKNTRRLIVVDPYAYGPSNAEAEDYVEDFAKTTRIHGSNLEALHIVYSENHGNTQKVKKRIKSVAKENGVKFSHVNTRKIHDRVWIADRRKAVLVGNSFQGLGRERTSFLLNIPDSDLNTFLSYLDKNNWSRRLTT